MQHTGGASPSSDGWDYYVDPCDAMGSPDDLHGCSTSNGMPFTRSSRDRCDLSLPLPRGEALATSVPGSSCQSSKGDSILKRSSSTVSLLSQESEEASSPALIGGRSNFSQQSPRVDRALRRSPTRVLAHQMAAVMQQWPLQEATAEARIVCQMSQELVAELHPEARSVAFQQSSGDGSTTNTSSQLTKEIQQESAQAEVSTQATAAGNQPPRDLFDDVDTGDVGLVKNDHRPADRDTKLGSGIQDGAGAESVDAEYDPEVDELREAVVLGSPGSAHSGSRSTPITIGEPSPSPHADSRETPNSDSRQSASSNGSCLEVGRPGKKMSPIMRDALGGQQQAADIHQAPPPRGCPRGCPFSPSVNARGRLQPPYNRRTPLLRSSSLGQNQSGDRHVLWPPSQRSRHITASTGRRPGVLRDGFDADGTGESRTAYVSFPAEGSPESSPPKSSTSGSFWKKLSCCFGASSQPAPPPAADTPLLGGRSLTDFLNEHR